jgi:protoporphyrinogen oxidase
MYGSNGIDRNAMTKKRAIIIGAGPAGLTAAFELLEKTDILPIVFEMSGDIGGISKTVNYKGNRIDIGGHRFFSKSDRVMQWWLERMPVQGFPARDDLILDRKVPLSTREGAPDPEKEDRVFLVRNRLSRIFFLRKFFDYPVALNRDTVSNLGMTRMVKIALSYLKARLFQIRPEKNLEDFFINRFGKELYGTFFRDYTEKVWGVPCTAIKQEWGAQRIKGLSITTALLHAARRMIRRDNTLTQKDTETSLIEQFLYPKFGPGQLWEEVAKKIVEQGGELHLNCEVTKLACLNGRIQSVQARNASTGEIIEQSGDYVISTMPVSELISALDADMPDRVRQTANGLMYRDFMTVGLLLKKLKIKNTTRHKSLHDILPDNWIYIQERDVRIGRLQIFNNWSPYLAHDPETVWIGLEYFCTEGDLLWSKTDDDFAAFAINELATIDIIDRNAVIDSCVLRVKKAYPAYFGSYDDFHVIKEFTDKIENLFLIGRNGMHRYNNADHSMLTAMVAVENIINRTTEKSNIWAVNTEEEYHESRQHAGQGGASAGVAHTRAA